MQGLRKKLLFPVLIGLNFFLGFESAGYQMVVLTMSQEFQVGSGTMGLMIATQYVAIMLMPLIFGRLSDTWGKKKVLLVSVPLFLLGCAIAVFSKSALVFTAGIFILGGGYSVSECISGAALVDANPANADRSVNTAQFVFSMGAVVSPLITAALMNRGFSWRTPFVLCGIGYLILWGLLVLTDIPAPAPAVCQTPEKGNPLRQVLSTKGFGLLVLAMIVYVSLENGIVYFADTLFTNELNAAQFGSYAISLFWLCMGLSRLLFSLFRYSAEKVVLGCQLCISLAIAGLALTRTPVPALVLFGLAGAFAGPTWPLIFSMASKSAPAYTGTASSLMSVSSGFGGALSPSVLGVMAGAFGMRPSYLLLTLVALCGFSALLLRRKKLGKEAKEAEETAAS